MPFNKGDPSLTSKIYSYLQVLLWICCVAFCPFATVIYFVYRIFFSSTESSSSSSSSSSPSSFPDLLLNEYFDLTCISIVWLFYEIIINVVLVPHMKGGWRSYSWSRSRLVHSGMANHFRTDIHFDLDITRKWAEEMKQKIEQRKTTNNKDNDNNKSSFSRLDGPLSYEDRCSSKINYDPEDEQVLVEACKKIFPLDEQAKNGEKYQKFLCTQHPHFYIGFTHWSAFLSIRDALDKVIFKRGLNLTVHTFDSNYLLPLWGILISFCGFVSATRQGIANAFKKKNSCSVEKVKTGSVSILVPGGAIESLTSPLQHDIILKDKAGFVKVALEEDALLIPCLHFGEERVYRQLLPESIFGKNFVSPRWFSWPLLDLTGVGFPLVYGRTLLLPALPMKTKFDVVLGHPLDTRKLVNEKFGEARKQKGLSENSAKFSREEVAYVHQEYVKVVKEMHARYAPIFSPDQELRIMDTRGRL